MLALLTIINIKIFDMSTKEITLQESLGSRWFKKFKLANEFKKVFLFFTFFHPINLMQQSSSRSSPTFSHISGYRGPDCPTVLEVECWFWAKDVAEASHFLQRVKNLAGGVVVWPCFQNSQKLGTTAKFPFKNCKLLNAVLPKSPAKFYKAHKSILIGKMCCLNPSLLLGNLVLTTELKT